MLYEVITLVAERKRYQSYYYKKDYKKARSLCYNCFEYGCPRAEECYFVITSYSIHYTKLYELLRPEVLLDQYRPEVPLIPLVRNNFV